MFGLRADMFSLYRICLVGSRICSVKLDLALRKSRSGANTMNVGPDKLTTSKQDTIEHIEKRGTTRNKLNTRNHT
jgi:hypothetical protein